MAFMIERIRNDTGINWEKLRIVGFSLGAHIVGYAGRNLRRKGLIVPRITGKINEITLCKKCPYSELFWCTEYLSVLSPNAGKMRTRVTPNTETFHVVLAMTFKSIRNKCCDFSY